MIAFWRDMDAERRVLAGQLLRYGVIGGGVTLAATLVYWIAARRDGPFAIPPLVANLIAYLVAVGLGYALHSRYSFRDHGTRTAGTGLRFAIASLGSFALNSAWVWLLVHQLHGATWWPIPLMVTATPLAIFWLNRVWVFA